MEGNVITFSPDRLPRGAGKAGNETMEALKNGIGPNPKPSIVYVITPEEIETRDTRRWIETFTFKSPPEILRGLRGIVTIAVDGFLEDPREIYEIAKVRAYFKLIHRVWPAWLHIADLSGPTLLLALLATSDDAACLKINGRAGVEVSVRKKIVEVFFRRAKQAHCLLNYCAQLSSKDYRSRSHEGERYLKLK